MANGKAGAPKGNTNSSKKNRMVADALRAAAKQNPDKLKKACMALMDKAVEGDIQAFNAFRDTLDGKPAQVVEGVGDNGEFIISISVDDSTVL